MIEKVDIIILEFIQQFQCPLLDVIMNILSLIGEMALIWFLFAVIYAMINKKWKVILILAVALLINHAICSGILKNIIKRIRPFKYDSNLITHAWKVPDGYSFPSGHSGSSFCSATVLSEYWKSNKILWYILALGVAISRIYLNVHYPSDILCGALFGICIGQLNLVYFSRSQKKDMDS